jgi:hypothetical protein
MDAGAPPVGAPAGAAPCVGAALLGKRVRLHSLNSIVFNDMAAAVIGWDHASGRWMVRLEGSGKELKVKPANVAFEDPADEPLAAMAGAMAAAAPAPVGEADGFTCAVCYEDYAAERRAVLPCCGTRESTVQYCQRCIEIIVEQGFGGTVGRCPTCSQLISIQGGVITGGHLVSRCRMCMQEKPIACPRKVLCELCVLGHSLPPMRYECQKCGRIQQIPHPMFRYQEEGPRSFGNVSWACHQRCGDYTMWRVVEQDVHMIPPEHCPASWGRRDEWLAQIREVRQGELAQDAGEERPAASRCSVS